MHRLPRAIFVVVLVGCNEVTTPGQPPVFTATPAAQWSGGEVTVSSAFLVGRATLPVLLAGPDTLQVTRLDDSTVSVRLPEGPSGPLRVTVARGSNGADSAFTVARFGFRETRSLPLPLMGELHVAMIGNRPVVFGSTEVVAGAEWDLARVDLGSGAGIAFPGLSSPGGPRYGMSPGYRPGEFLILRDSADGAQSPVPEYWSLEVPIGFRSSTPFAAGFVRHAARLSSHVWLRTDHHFSYTTNDSLAPPQTVVSYRMESVWDVYVSPRGDRTTVSVNTTPPIGPLQPGVPVFDNLTGDTAFTLPISGVYAAAFSDDGSRLFAVGGLMVSPNQLVAVDADDGTVLAQVALPDGLEGVGLAYDPVGDVLLAATVRPEYQAILVYRASDLHLVGRLPAPDPCPWGTALWDCNEGVVAVDPVTRLAHLVHSDPSKPSWVFDLLP